ncbi:hypothetical protein CSB20_09165 [bacterium DOLZORAL124_64_63]|nr:MAG: hypothetical protein CSB20_09165 [bacterium DOLZORAL124_64_63]
MDWQPWPQEFPAGNTRTRWYHWNTAPYLTAAGTPVLACVAEAFDTSAHWPDVRYGNSSRAVLISPPLDQAIRVVRLTHACEVEYLRAGVLMDGATVWWQDAAGERIPASSLEGPDGVIHAGSSNPLRGISALGDSLMVLDDQHRPRWRVDSFPVPDQRPGPWRLVLDFASNGLYAGRGWFIARIEGLTDDTAAAFQLRWTPAAGECSGLMWDWPQAQGPLSAFQVQTFDAEARRFRSLPGISAAAAGCSQTYLAPAEQIRQALAWDGNRRHTLRVLGEGEMGPVVSRPVYVYPDGGPDPILYLEKPYPNPTSAGVRFQVDWPGPGGATVGVYDLRGRLLHARELSAGSQQLIWDGCDPDGRRAAAGTYFLRLEGSGRVVTRKVVLLR